MPNESTPPRLLRALLLGTLVLGLVGTEIELLLLEHYEGIWQIIPHVLIAVALLALLARLFVRGPGGVRLVQGTMAVFLVSGLLGVWQHYGGNATFELEIEPAMPAWPLFKAAITGATPVLAPGMMIQLGLIGLAWSFRHPDVRRET